MPHPSEFEFQWDSEVARDLAAALGIKVGMGVGRNPGRPNAQWTPNLSKSVNLPPGWTAPPNGVMCALDELPVTIYWRGPFGPIPFAQAVASIKSKRRIGVNYKTYEQAVADGGEHLHLQKTNQHITETGEALARAKEANRPQANIKVSVTPTGEVVGAESDGPADVQVEAARPRRGRPPKEVAA
jgi:hypothetical protein